MTRKSLLLFSGVFGLACSPLLDAEDKSDAPQSDSRQEFESYTVAASSIQVSPQETDSSISVFTGQELLDPNSSHLEDLVLDTPNLTFAGGTSRARFFQIRGIGEYDNYEEPVTPSVGLVIDGIDFSGFGNIVSLFDVERVEVLRGPQSGLYGTQALAGLIYIESTNPTDYWTGQVEGTVAEYDTYRGGVAVGGPLDFLSDNLTMRLSVYQNNTDGGTYNEFLGRHAGSDQDEFTSRLKVQWEPSDNFRLKVTGLYSDFQNGYDNFTLTANEGSHTVYSDMPGEDNQRSSAIAVEAGIGPLESEWVSRTTFQKTKTKYSFDADWINTSDDPRNLQFWQEIWGEPGPQSWSEDYNRETRRVRQEFLYRFNEGPETTRYTVGVGGTYIDQDSEAFENYPTDAFGPYSNTAENTYDEGQLYTFGEILYPLGDKHQVGGTLRLEGRNLELKDSGSPQFVGSADDQEFLWGGDISYNYLMTEAQAFYIKLARGYKGGGINADRNANQLYYDPEALYEVEGGWNFARPDGRLESRVSVFAFTRDDPQVRRWEIDPGFNYVLTQTNAESSYGYGLEGSASWMALDWLEVGGSLGLLQSKIEADNIPTLADGRDQAMAPGYTFSAYGEVRPIPEAFLRLKVRGQDSVYYDSFYNGKSDAYQLFDLWAGYMIGGFEINFWITNLFDTDYGTRSVYFGDYNDPAFVPDLHFESLGDPRQIGVTVRYFF
ncbi:TonB-dependent receptor [Puniceicoccus vermicola]|uniref:TonB-dependent receptor n=1 Tax=Puniceicoccus vermicola TaxID=388746 RepID=A0A7X1AW02_9BACT|nr:TonB-dependent receptor [Puniceicoccus vermicola]MBC2601031.1 TonB-dependent receptor [Puniceicoccus vermicola]